MTSSVPWAARHWPAGGPGAANTEGREPGSVWPPQWSLGTGSECRLGAFLQPLISGSSPPAAASLTAGGEPEDNV